MPVIATTDQDTALRLQRAIVEGDVDPPEDRISVVTGWPEGAGFLVGDELMTAYEADIVAHADAPDAPACRSGNPCYSAMCGEGAGTGPVLISVAVVDGDIVLTGTGLDNCHHAIISTVPTATQLPVVVVNSTTLRVVGGEDSFDPGLYMVAASCGDNWDNTNQVKWIIAPPDSTAVLTGVEDIVKSTPKAYVVIGGVNLQVGACASWFIEPMGGGTPVATGTSVAWGGLEPNYRQGIQWSAVSAIPNGTYELYMTCMNNANQPTNRLQIQVTDS